MPKKTFDCGRCNGHHKRPINSTCKREINESGQNKLNDDMSVQNLAELKHHSSRLQKVEEKNESRLFCVISRVTTNSQDSSPRPQGYGIGRSIVFEHIQTASV